MSTLSTTNLKNASSGSNNIVLNTDGTTTIAAPSNIIKSGTAVASTSGVAIDFTGLPSWVKRITVMFDGVSTNGSSAVLLQLGDSGGIETSGYLGAVNDGDTAAQNGQFSSGFADTTASAAIIRHGQYTFSNITGNTWACVFQLGFSNAAAVRQGAGSKTLSGTLDRVRITTVNGTDTFDAGSINILYEG